MCCPCRLTLPKLPSKTSHLNGKLVFAHPSNLAGIRVAIDSGVDVLAHAPDDTRGIGPGAVRASGPQEHGDDADAEDVCDDRDDRLAVYGSDLR